MIMCDRTDKKSKCIPDSTCQDFMTTNGCMFARECIEINGMLAELSKMKTKLRILRQEFGEEKKD